MDALEVRLEGALVGLLERFEDWTCRFSFHSSWLEAPERPVLGQFFEDQKPREVETVGHVPCWFDHLLPPPQSPLWQAVVRQAQVDPDDPMIEFDLLGFLGEDLPGAVVMTPSRPRLAREPRAAPPTRQVPEGSILFALAGQQWKLSVRPGDRGLVVPVRGETGQWLAKFHDPMYRDLPRVEHATMRWAELSGVQVPQRKLAHVAEFDGLPEGVPIGDGSVYLIERFDRKKDGSRIHMEDFAQVLDRPLSENSLYGGAHEEIAAILAHLSPGDVRQFVERVVFSALCGNTDGHLKNWSLLYVDARRPVLSPAYDVISSVLYVPPLDDRMALGLGGSRRFEDARVESFETMAEVVGVSFAEVSRWVREAAERIRNVFSTHREDLSYRPHERARLEKHLARVPLSQGRR
ncbi:type II toxin-antitoxin system HipA family toxin [Sorangium sp. So ce295]|uniref:type II toxin-antitoxin system HipA family toxin n=1 Tax=Sorangium sp. So ce295 TaxID=3133295 RepID=UPI003F644190